MLFLNIIRKTIKPLVAGLVVLFLGTFIATFLNLFDYFPHIDKLFHITGGFIVAWFFSDLWVDELKGLNQFQRVIIFMALGALVGFFWEIMEYTTSKPPFVSNQLLRHYIYGGDLTDTLGDLMADVFGGALFGFFKR